MIIIIIIIIKIQVTLSYSKLNIVYCKIVFSSATGIEWGKLEQHILQFREFEHLQENPFKVYMGQVIQKWAK